jgi:hypothetical protein
MTENELEGKDRIPSATGPPGPIPRRAYCASQCYERGKRKLSRSCTCKACHGDAHGRGKKYARDHGYLKDSPPGSRKTPLGQEELPFPEESPVSIALPNRNEEKRRIERIILEAARNAGAPIPTGERDGKEPAPDFLFDTDDGRLGIELTELLCPGGSGGTKGDGLLPIKKEAIHKEIIAIAQKQYYGTEGTQPARAHVVFANSIGECSTKQRQELGHALCDYVRINLKRAKSDRTEMPSGFSTIVIVPESGDWWHDECVAYTVDDIRRQLAQRIAAKNRKIQKYRTGLHPCAQIWLLLHTGSSVTRHVAVPRQIQEWRFSFDFEKVFWFVFEENRIIEIQSADHPVTPGERQA